MRRPSTPFKTIPGGSWLRRRAWWAGRPGPSEVGSAAQALASPSRTPCPFAAAAGFGAGAPASEADAATAAGTAGRPEGAAGEARCLDLSLGQFRSTQAGKHWRSDVKTIS